ncbi:MAG: glycerophosphodiester phosphodiesterase [Calditrichaeota bacterium]|nr:glycerophosphodiester phosphodiesterase [Calditrichota bacterium]
MLALPLIIGHRGASYLAPENTLASINLAWQSGVEAVEIDVQMTRDKKIVVFHDADTKRLAGTHKKIADSLYSDLVKLDIGKSKGEKWAGEKIALLSDVLATIPPHGQIFIEVKGGEKMIPPLAEIVNASSLLPEQVNFLAFDPFVAASLKKTFSTHIVCLNFEQTIIPLIHTKELLSIILANNLDGVDISVKPPLKSSLIEEIHGQGKKIFVWVVDEPAEAKRLAKIGIDGIISNRPAWLREQLNLSV